MKKVLFILFCFFTTFLSAQEHSVEGFWYLNKIVDEHDKIVTKSSDTVTLEILSNQIYTYKNKRLNKSGKWKYGVENKSIFLSFRGVKEWELEQTSKLNLTLIFDSPYGLIKYVFYDKIIQEEDLQEVILLDSLQIDTEIVHEEILKDSVNTIEETVEVDTIKKEDSAQDSIIIIDIKRELIDSIEYYEETIVADSVKQELIIKEEITEIDTIKKEVELTVEERIIEDTIIYEEIKGVSKPNELDFLNDLKIVESEEIKEEKTFTPDDLTYKTKEKELSEKFMEISMIGGGFYGGLDPVVKDYILIKNDGRVIREHKTLNGEETKTTQNVTREDLEKFILFMDEKGFFEMDLIYDCETALCKRRQERGDTPIPLRITANFGLKRNVVSVAIYDYGINKPASIDLPKPLLEIIQNIQKVGF